MMRVMAAILLDGEAIAKKIYGSLAQELKRLPRPPRLFALVVGAPAPATRIFLERKKQACDNIGIAFRLTQIPATGSRTVLAKRVRESITGARADGIIIQLPLPGPFRKNPHALLRLIPEEKDADCLTEKWLGRMQSGRMTIVIKGRPATLIAPVAGAVEKFLAELRVNPAGKRALVIGWGELVGKPCAAWLLHQGATVTVVQKSEPDLAELLSQAEIIVSGAGVSRLVAHGEFRKDAVVIDAGVSAPGGNIRGDVDVQAVARRVFAVVPTPGGVGPVTVAVLLENVVKLAKAHLGV